MKKYVFSAFIALIGFVSYSQELPTYAPVSPNAASIGKFGTFPVNTNLGTTNVSIPLYTIKQGDIEIPINLTYNATSGIRVNEKASWVGLGWTLNAGGAIVRSVQGQPSTNDIPDLGSLDFNWENYRYMYDVARGWADTAQDMYFLNYSGVSGKFCYDQNKSSFEFSDYKPIKISASSDTKGYIFEATLSNGQRLAFNSHEITEKTASGLPLNYREFRSASYLTEVTSRNQVDNVLFEYDDLRLNIKKEITSDVIVESIGVSPGLNWIPKSPSPVISTPTNISSKVIRKITFKNGYVLFDYSLDRIDSDSPKLNKIRVYSLRNNIHDLIKEITFNYTYYIRTGGESYRNSIGGDYITEHYTRSLKLDSVDIYSNNSKKQTYSFEYNSTRLPLRNSSAQDFWGYPNTNTGSYIHRRNASFYGVDSNDCPYQNCDYNSEASILSFSGSIGSGNREPDEAKSKAGILTKITYPTGGYTIFEYEANKFMEEVTVPVYESKRVSLMSEGTGIFNCDTGLKTLNFRPTSIPYNAKLRVVFSQANGGQANSSFGEFNGTKYYRSAPTNVYPDTTHNIDINLNVNSDNTIKANELGNGAPGASGCPSVSVTVTWDELSGNNTEMIERFAGGLRIKSIRNFDGNNELPISRKEYVYEGLRQLIPILDGDFQTLKYNGTGGYVNTISSSPGYSLNVNGGPSVEYRKVTELDYDLEGKDNGKKVYEYEFTVSDRIIGNGGAGAGGQIFKPFLHPEFLGSICEYANGAKNYIPSSGIPVFNNIRVRGYGNFSNYYTKSWTSGSLKRISNFKRNEDDSYTKVSEIENGYNLVDESSLFFNYVHAMTPYSTQNVSSSDFNSDRVCGNFANYTFMYNKGFYSFGKKLLTSSIERVYDGDEVEVMATTRSYTYNNPHYFKTEENITNSEGDLLTTNTFYPTDKGNPRFSDLSNNEKNALNSLIVKNMVSVPIETISYKDKGTANEKKLVRQRTLFQDLGEKTLQKTIQTSKGNESLEDRIVYHDYDSKGNAIWVSKKDGTNIVYLWGYDYTQPIAKIENATYAQVMTALGRTTTDDLSYFQNYTESQIQTEINRIRTNLVNAQVTTYTYKPLIGVSAITDPRGERTSFHYDDFNRLEFVKDSQGNILKEHKYNYKN